MDLPFDISPTQVAELLRDDSIQLVDVREPYEREAGHVAGSRHVPLAELTAAAPTIDPSVRSSSSAAWARAPRWRRGRSRAPASTLTTSREA